MGKSISLFSGYNQKENRTTNYCLLILKLLYEENPKYLSEVLSQLAGEEAGNAVGVKFEQQSKRANSIPDGLITQSAFSVFLETKNFNWFYDDQLERHLQALDMQSAGLKVLIALSNFESGESRKFDNITALCESKYQGRIAFATVSFGEFYECLQELNLPKNLADIVTEFGEYLDSNWLLPTWERRLDVVNCASSTHEIIDGNVYMCPAKGGAYRHQRSKYFGMYSDKRVQVVAFIEGVIVLNDFKNHTVKWINGDLSAEELIRRAVKAKERFRPESPSMQVFILGDLHETCFWKDSKGGMLGSKRYFGVEYDTVEELASALKERGWSEF